MWVQQLRGRIEVDGSPFPQQIQFNVCVCRVEIQHSITHVTLLLENHICPLQFSDYFYSLFCFLQTIKWFQISFAYNLFRFLFFVKCSAMKFGNFISNLLLLLILTMMICSALLYILTFFFVLFQSSMYTNNFNFKLVWEGENDMSESYVLWKHWFEYAPTKQKHLKKPQISCLAWFRKRNSFDSIYNFFYSSC